MSKERFKLPLGQDSFGVDMGRIIEAHADLGMPEAKRLQAAIEALGKPQDEVKVPEEKKNKPTS